MLPGAAAAPLLPPSLPLVQCSPPCRAGRAFSSSVACVAPYSRNTMPLPSLPPSLPSSPLLLVAPPPQLSVEPKVPFLRSLAHFAFAATSLARPRGFLARHGGRPRQHCWPPSIPQKLLPQRGARRQPGRPRGHSQTGTRAGRERAPRERERERSAHAQLARVPRSLVRVTDGGRTVDRRSKARWSRAARPRVEGNVRQTRWMREGERASAMV